MTNDNNNRKERRTEQYDFTSSLDCFEWLLVHYPWVVFVPLGIGIIALLHAPSQFGVRWIVFTGAFVVVNFAAAGVLRILLDLPWVDGGGENHGT